MNDTDRTEQREDWHKAKVFSISHLVATLIAIFGGATGFYYFAQDFGVLKSDVARHEVQIQSIQSDQVIRDNALSTKLNDMRKESDSKLNRIEDKLDRLIERRQ